MAALGVAAVIAPWTLRNTVVLGAPVLLSTQQVGMALTFAHSDFADGGMSMRMARLRDARLAEFRDLPQPEREVAENRAEVRRAIRYMLSHPLRELSLVPRRWRELFAHDHEALTWAAPRGSRGEIVGPVFGDVWDRRVARLADVAFYAVALLALAGLPACFDSRRSQRLLLPGTLLYTLFLHGILFAGDARFHAPLYPTLAILAPVGALVLWRVGRGRGAADAERRAWMACRAELGSRTAMTKKSRRSLLVLSALSVAACNGDGLPTYTVGGTVVGLSGPGLVLQLNGGHDLQISSNGAFQFQTALTGQTDYEVTVLNSPSGQSSTVAMGSGKMPFAPVTDVEVTCTADTYTVGGSVVGSGSGTGLVLQLNGGADLAISGDGPYAFPEPLVDGAAYAVTVLSAPPGSACNLSNASGTIQGADVTNADVECVAVYSVGGVVEGLSGPGLVLQLNGGADLAIGGDGAYAFPERLTDGASYTVTVLSIPPGSACDVSNASGTIQGADVTDVDVDCHDVYSVGGVVEGLSGPGLVLQLNGGADLAIGANGPYSFPERLADGASYTVTVLSIPPGSACDVSNASGTIQGADVTDVDVDCFAVYSVGGVVGGLAGPGLILQLNGGGDLALDRDGTFAFEALLPAGASYDVTVSGTPPGQACVVAGGSGTVGGGDVTSVAVTCSAVVTGLVGTSSSKPSLYNSIDPATGAATAVSTNIAFEGVTGLAYDPGSRLLFAADVATETLLTVDPLFGTATPVGSQGDLGIPDINGLALDAQSDVLYGISSTSGATLARLVEIDPSTGVATYVGSGFPIGAAVCLGLAFVDPSGLLYASTDDGRLILVDPDTGASSGELPLGATISVDGLAYDADAGRLYGTSDQQRVIEIDPATGQTSLVGLVEGFFGVNGLAFAPDLGVLFGTDVNPGGAGFLLNIDPHDASGHPVGSTGFRIAGLAHDPATGVMFGITPNSLFVRMDPNTGESRYVARVQTPDSMQTRSLVFNPGSSTLFTYAIDPDAGGEDFLIELDRDGAVVQDHGASATLGGDFEALAVDASGPTMYGILDRGLGSPGVLCQVETDGKVLLLHKLVGYDQLRSLAFDPSTAGTSPTLYAADGAGGMLIRIDLMTGAVTEVGPTPDARGMAWVTP